MGGILASRARYYQKLLVKVNTKCWAKGTCKHIMRGRRLSDPNSKPAECPPPTVNEIYSLDAAFLDGPVDAA